MIKRIIILILLAIPAIAYSNGGGGIFYGTYYPVDQFTNISPSNTEVFGGFGYETDWKGYRSGGFGMVIKSDTGTTGGFGGVIGGREAYFGPLIIGGMGWVGFGGTDYGLSAVVDITADVGINITDWMQLQVYGGMHSMAAIPSITETIEYTPVYGVRLLWGSF